MKTVFSIIAVASIIITACMVYLIKSGTSIRSEGLIRPTPIKGDLNLIARGAVVRLSPQFQNSHYVVVDFDQNDATGNALLKAIAAEYENDFQKKVNWVDVNEGTDPKAVADCPQPCWIKVGKGQAHQLARNEWIETKLQPLGREYFSLSWLPFTRNVEVTPECNAEKRLSFGCLQILAVHEALRKMRDANQRYFFMRKYLNRDVFLFTEKN